MNALRDMEKDLQRLMSVLLSTGKDLRQLMPNPGCTETSVTTDGLLTAMATMERGQHILAMINVTQHQRVTFIESVVVLRSKYPQKNRKNKSLGRNRRLMTEQW